MSFRISAASWRKLTLPFFRSSPKCFLVLSIFRVMYRYFSLLVLLPLCPDDPGPFGYFRRRSFQSIAVLVDVLYRSGIRPPVFSLFLSVVTFSHH